MHKAKAWFFDEVLLFLYLLLIFYLSKCLDICRFNKNFKSFEHILV